MTFIVFKNSLSILPMVTNQFTAKQLSPLNSLQNYYKQKQTSYLLPPKAVFLLYLNGSFLNFYIVLLLAQF